jgi:subtilisin family serine protease
MESQFQYKKDWGFTQLGIDEVWEFSKGIGIRIAVVDSGLNYSLADFIGKTNIEYFDALTGSNRSSACRDDASGHGTECAGILCAQGYSVTGVAPEATLLIIKITDSTGARKSGAILRGLEKAIDEGSDVISLSFSLPLTDPNFRIICQRIRDAFRKDIAVFAAVGDSGFHAFPVDNYPASLAECISVGGIDQNRMRSRYSCKSNFLDLMAPGEKLISVTNPHKKIHGTSFATAFAAGVAVLLKSIALQNGYLLSVAEISDILKRTAEINHAAPHDPSEYGWGILNPAAAMKMLISRINLFK